MDNQKLVIAREWSHPEIHVWISDESIGMRMGVQDYLIALVEEVGNPTLLLTKAQLLEKLKAANNTVTASVKGYSKAVV